ncbi:MAG TPA: hypothetical protein VHL59_03215 [Thermoanaerobaculia bacterium]|nr:hypothetical protein [Thermoanaerobaculia bacterium]
MNLLVLLLTLTTTTLVLRSGDRMPVDSVREENGVLTFRSNGTLYSMPASEVARVVHGEEAPAPREEQTPRMRLRVSEEERRRLIEELEKNHSGTPVSREQLLQGGMAPLPQNTDDEWEWKNRARAHEEAIVRASEHLALLETREQELRARIFSLISLGFAPRQFTYDTTILARTQEQIPYARLALARAERQYEQFREEARRRGVMPGWLR